MRDFHIPDQHPPIITPAHIKILRQNKRNCDWLDKYSVLVEFKKQLGRFPKAKEVWHGINIGIFKDRVHHAHNKGKIKWYQFKLMDQIGFSFKPTHESWDSNYDRLKECWNKHSDSYPFIPKDYPDADFLQRWIKLQREARSKGRLSAGRKRLLDKIEFPWDHNEAMWVRSYRILAKKQEWIPSAISSDPEEQRLASWSSTQRQFRKKGKLPKDKIRLLDKIGFRWTPHDMKWERQYIELKAFVKMHNRLPVNKQERYGEYLLSAWYFQQKKLARRGQLNDDRLEKMKTAGFLSPAI